MTVWAVALIAAGLVFVACGSIANAAEQHVFDHVLKGGEGDPGTAHPKKTFNDPCGVTTDEFGNLYVANGAEGAVGGESEGVIDIFNSANEFLAEIPNDQTPCSMAVDSTGRLYVYENGPNAVVRYEPLIYEPATGEIEYDPNPVTVVESKPNASIEGMALDPSNDHLIVSYAEFESKHRFEEYLPTGTLDPANPPFTENVFADPRNLAIWGQTQDIYSTGSPRQPAYDPFDPHVYVLDAVTNEVKLVLPDDSDAPSTDFGFTSGNGGLAVDQSNGDVYVDGIDAHKTIYQFDAAGNFVGKIDFKQFVRSFPYNSIAVDQGAGSPNQGFVYVTSGNKAGNSNVFAFAPRETQPPEIRNTRLESAGETEARVGAELNPHGLDTRYHFEYGPSGCDLGGCKSVPLPDADAGSGGIFRPVSVSLAGLSPGATYHFRLVASNHCNELEPEEECIVEGPDSTFTTFRPIAPAACPNEGLRSGPSSALADCRGYELFTPADTNGRVPTGAIFGSASYTSPPVRLVSSDGGSVVFGTEGGTLPGMEGGGYFDGYRSIRDSQGWHTELNGPTGPEAQEAAPGGVSDDHGYSLWLVLKQKGSLAAGQYLRGPGGGFEKVALGSMGSGLGNAVWVSPGAGHLVFTATVPLEPGAPPSGTRAVYDRSSGGSTRLVSWLPGEVTPGAGESATYLGTAQDGSAVAFAIGGATFVRVDDSETVEVSADPVSFAGISSDGERVFYVKGGNVFAFETDGGTTTPVGGGGESTVVNVSADGSHVFFISPVVLTGIEANSQGDKASAGSENLYAWDVASPGALRYVATVEEEDVVGEDPPLGGDARRGGLGLWMEAAVNPVQARNVGPANDPSRTSASGSVFVFESRAKLTEYDNAGHSEIYKYDSSAAELTCISCSPTNAPAASDARLESRYAPFPFSIPPVNAVSDVGNIAAGGGIVFFQSADRLAAGDADSAIDVYEWQAQGVKHCEAEAGCIALISGGRSTTDDYLYGASSDGSSVFFLSNDTLVAKDQDNTPSIYVAREGGGEEQASPPPTECSGEACQPFAAAPDSPMPSSSTFVGPGNGAKKSCPKGRRKVKKDQGGVRCVKRHQKQRKHRRAHAKGKAAR
jgi:hypothetical protein